MDDAPLGGQTGRIGDRGVGLAYDCVGDVEKNELKPHLCTCWVIPPEKNGAFVAAMEDALEVYKRKRKRDYPLVCMDE